MIIALLGYMGCGKSAVGKWISEEISYRFRDLDAFISERNDVSVKEIFEKKGELFFRKEEHKLLKELLEEDEIVLSLGGGTPTYYNNMELINNSSFSIFLQAKSDTLTERLFPEKDKRPLLSHLKTKEELREFITIHLWERNIYYQQAKLTINIENKTVEEIGKEIITHLPNH